MPIDRACSLLGRNELSLERDIPTRFTAEATQFLFFLLDIVVEAADGVSDLVVFGVVSDS